MASERIGVYPGTFDPTTSGHLEVMRRSLRLVDKLVIGCAINIGKGPLFSLEERMEIVGEDIADFPAEDRQRIQVANMNARMEPEIETIFLMASDRHQFIASSLVKDIARLGGDTSQFVSKRVFERLKAKFAKG
jgi:pantetheine-phosphate adenylyltransferase